MAIHINNGLVHNISKGTAGINIRVTERLVSANVEIEAKRGSKPTAVVAAEYRLTGDPEKINVIVDPAEVGSLRKGLLLGRLAALRFIADTTANLLDIVSNKEGAVRKAQASLEAYMAEFERSREDAELHYMGSKGDPLFFRAMMQQVREGKLSKYLEDSEGADLNPDRLLCLTQRLDISYKEEYIQDPVERFARLVAKIVSNGMVPEAPMKRPWEKTALTPHSELVRVGALRVQKTTKEFTNSLSET